MQRLIYAVLFLILFACNLAGAATKYVIKDLGIVSGDVESTAEAINNKGQIIVRSWPSPDSKRSDAKGFGVFLWEAGHSSGVKTPVGRIGTMRADVNDSGVILLVYADDSYIVDKGRVTKINPLPGTEYMDALRINNAGDVFGWCHAKSGDGRACVRRGGVMTALKLPLGYRSVTGGSLNNQGQIACTVEKDDSNTKIALWENGAMRVIEGLPDSFGLACLSDDGTLVGSIDDGSQHLVWRKGLTRNLKAPERTAYSWVTCMNSKGVIAGCYRRWDNEGTRAVVWDKDGVVTELPMLDGKESFAVDINAEGIIVGEAYDKDHKCHAVMWTPVK